MLWFYKRGSETVELETRLEDSSDHYVVVIRRPDGTEEARRFADTGTCEQYLREIEHRMEQERWQLTGGPTILPHGWRL